METFLVGGAVRDRLLGLPVGDRDWVVVGGTPEELLEQGFKQVGRGFPVFLHPETGEEYALARTERKTAAGYRGFAVQAGPGVSLRDDLRRRDLTINALAETTTGQLVDYWGGQEDLRLRVLRHVSPAFTEDPVRVLRVARFAARFHPMGFSVAPETLALMREMVEAGEVDALVPERVWAETARALATRAPLVYFQVLHACGALRVVYPEVEPLFGEAAPGPAARRALALAARAHAAPEVRLAALLHPLDPALIAASCARLRAPGTYRNLAGLVAREHPQAAAATALGPEALLALIERTDGLRRRSRFERFALACAVVARARGTPRACTPAAHLLGALERVAGLDVRTLRAETRAEGPALAAEIRRARLRALAVPATPPAPGG